MSYLRKKKIVSILILLLAMVGILQVARGYFGAEEKKLRSQLRASVQQQFPVAFEKNKSGYGLHRYMEPLSEEVSTAKGGKVILVHGLDDPGIIWESLGPILVKSGYQVWIMNYPNDQPIRDSANYFGQQLELFVGDEGPAPVAIVGHSMGGLVTREMLTNPNIGYEGKIKAGLVPAITHFIMVGTPNHGSIFSRLRFFTEVRDQLVSAGKGQYQWLRSVFDGMGEAGIDLYPGSDFLGELNGRPLFAADKMLIIAGIMSPWDQKDITKGIEEIKQSFPESAETSFVKFQPLLEKMITDVGDGLVSVDSASLAGVPLVQVQGTHVSIIRNLTNSSKRVPPAIPIILRELEDRRL